MAAVKIDTRDRIRIAYILPNEVRGGVEEHVLSLIKGIDKNRFEVFLIAPPRLLESLHSDLEPGDADVLPLRISSLLNVREMVLLYKFLRDKRIHLVNTHMFIATFYYALPARLAGVPIVFETTHLIEKWRLEKGFIHRNSFIIDKLFYGLLDKVLAVSHACKNDLIKIKKISPAKITVVHNGRDLSRFDPSKVNRREKLRQLHQVEEDELIFGVFARLNHQKGHKYLLTAVKILQDRGVSVKVFLIGDGELRESLVNQSDELGIADKIFFIGFQNDIPGYLSMIDVMVLPSLYEGLPLCVIESLAMEKPVIATAVDGTPEIVIPHKTGLLVEPEDCEGLAEAMIFAQENPEKFELMGKNGRQFVCENFSITIQISRTEALYNKLCFQKGVMI